MRKEGIECFESGVRMGKARCSLREIRNQPPHHILRPLVSAQPESEAVPLSQALVRLGGIREAQSLDCRSCPLIWRLRCEHPIGGSRIVRRALEQPAVMPLDAGEILQ